MTSRKRLDHDVITFKSGTLCGQAREKTERRLAAMNYALDIIFLCVLLLFTVVGVRRGFIRSGLHFLGTVIAAFLASALGGAVAQWVFDALFRDALVSRVNEGLAAIGTDSVELALQNVLSSLPDFLTRALTDAGVTVSSLQGILANSNAEAAEVITDSLAPVFVSYLKVLAVIVLFFLFVLLVRPLSQLIAGIFRLPLLRQVDGLLGGVFGLLLALVALWVAVSAVQVFLPMLTGSVQADVQVALDHSILAGALIRINPLSIMFS